MRTSISGPHTLSAFDADLHEVTGLILQMSGLVIVALEKALCALTNSDENIAREVTSADRIIDELQAGVERTVVRTIALRAPMADDLRALVVAIRMASLLERAGDHAKSISRHPERVSPCDAAGALNILGRMGEHAVAMLRDAVTAYAASDCKMAGAVRARDAELDRLFVEVHQLLLRRMKDDPHFASPGTQLLMIGKKIERVGDYAASISDSVQYMVTGEHFTDWSTAPDLSVAA